MKDFLRRFDWISFAAAAALVAAGTVAVYSAGHAREAVFHGMWKAHLSTAAVGACVMFALAAVDYRKILAVAAWPAYAAALAMLVLVLAAGSEIYGGKRWLWFFQPSEVAKLCVIAVFAHFFGEVSEPGMKGARWKRGWRGLALAGALFGVPAALILKEPDLGTAIVLFPAVAVMLLVCGVCRKGLLAAFGAGALAALALLCAVYEAEKPGTDPETRAKILKFVPLKNHQERRVKTFLFPEKDTLGDGYTLRQSRIAIGSGGLSGKGIGRAETNHLRFLPPSVSMNDFIFCVWAEETGFVGSVALLLLFAAVVGRSLLTAARAGDAAGASLAAGVATLLFAHSFVNMAMTVGLAPITGLPLPFISSGRTFLATMLAGLGFVQSVATHVNKEAK